MIFEEGPRKTNSFSFHFASRRLPRVSSCADERATPMGPIYISIFIFYVDLMHIRMIK